MQVTSLFALRTVLVGMTEWCSRCIIFPREKHICEEGNFNHRKAVPSAETAGVARSCDEEIASS
jgi:hypothetical protein